MPINTNINPDIDNINPDIDNIDNNNYEINISRARHFYNNYKYKNIEPMTIKQMEIFAIAYNFYLVYFCGKKLIQYE